MSDEKDYGVSTLKQARDLPAPALDYLPPRPKDPAIPIALIGAGNIAEFHLKNYKAAGFNVVAICDRNRDKAQAKARQFYPDARVCDRFEDVLNARDVVVVDVTPHPADRLPMVRAALQQGKHVLSQKPFAEALDDAEGLVRLADANGVRLAVNQNGRWAPHFCWMTEAVRTGLVGDVTTVDFVLQWDQTWIAGNPGFERIHHMVLWDFAIHWFDIAGLWMHGRDPRHVYAAAAKFDGQRYNPPGLAHAVIDYGDAQVRMCFNAHCDLGEQDQTTIVGTRGTLRATGPSLNVQRVDLYTAEGHARPDLRGDWFTNGFQGTMGELLCAVEQGREPRNSGRDNLRSLELAFAAVASAERGETVRPGQVRQLLRK